MIPLDLIVYHYRKKATKVAPVTTNNTTTTTATMKPTTVKSNKHNTINLTVMLMTTCFIFLLTTFPFTLYNNFYLDLISVAVKKSQKAVFQLILCRTCLELLMYR